MRYAAAFKRLQQDLRSTFPSEPTESQLDAQREAVGLGEPHAPGACANYWTCPNVVCMTARLHMQLHRVEVC